ncbi:MAG: Ku protein [Thermoanaerobaculia bacterium]
MAARAIWKGVIRFGKTNVPVRLFSAVEDHTVHFRLLHRKDRTPVKQRLINPSNGKEVAYADVRKAYEVSRGVFVLLDEEELARLEPAPSKDIEITRFVDPSEIDHRWYERPYFLGPDGDDEAYFALAAALAKEGREGVARWTMRKKEYVGALRVEDGYLVLVSLHHADQVIATSGLEAPQGRAIEKRERDMAQQLVESLAADFHPEEFHDQYRERVMELVETKRRGGKVKVTKFRPKPTEEPSLAKTLEASLARSGKGKKSA